MKDLGRSMLTGDLDFSTDLVRQMARLGAANASTTSTEEFRQKMAEVERMLREMKERSLGSQEELARREHEEAQKRESDSVAQILLGLAIPGSLAWSQRGHYTSWSRLESALNKQAPLTSFTVVLGSPLTLYF